MAICRRCSQEVDIHEVEFNQREDTTSVYKVVRKKNDHLFVTLTETWDNDTIEEYFDHKGCGGRVDGFEYFNVEEG